MEIGDKYHQSQKGIITIQRCSVESQKGIITIQRCSVESQKGIITIQRCSVENQKGATYITVYYRVYEGTAFLVLNGRPLNSVNALLVLS